MKSFLKYNTLSILWALCILTFCLMPGKDIPPLSIFEFDKVIHAGIYLFLSVFTYYGWTKQNTFATLHRNTFIKILILAPAYGFIVEILQELLTSDRRFEIFDAVANSSGAALGCLISFYLLKPAKV